ncbi:Rrf2 family transcriptional regulator [Paraburkholderia silvatlantica]|uniref:Transcriptional regulator n=2 Tax=cellular organisms TaxID=131567 RepID=W2TM89_NECAM|nr:Rrf2 family transcriptional regulator [Paraburkholderia silvatlantica]XP_013305090.1 transcriptional regulator [Necator americanus]ETN82863.1 transcriptional regulator [Necator americanus]MBB2930651.1 DNA-binding IscR family transcriptional regulator [Paraburkholderia silvatlantica]PVY30451.1 BadM/Rrf2 family transcriptional regulator [Paraburkholderia silvatlantica]PXW36812.1 BadM/Rrf2 family transcriptional regulator [Paraburkholderia silvatlantica]
MQRDTRLARLLHILIHMHLRGGASTSETIALMLHTNPVLVRRTMAALRESGYVKSTGGPGGGWVLACDLNDLTVRDIYDAIGHTAPFVIGLADDNRTCPVEAAVNHHIDEVLGSAENTFLQLLGEKRLSEIAHNVTTAKSRKTIQ